MVFFTCNACGESMKKAQVEKHYTQKCRQCEVLSCVDCGKDFWGEEYQQHVKCISEEEKYSGKNYKPKPGANKGEVKQELWTQQVQSAIEKAPANNPKLKGILQKLVDYPNIPRKKAKFENFLKNSLRLHDQRLLTQTWDLINAEIAQQKPQPTPNGNTEKDVDNASKVSTEDSTEASSGGETQEGIKQTKREKKEERRKNNLKQEKKDKRLRDSEENGDKESKKKKKRKHEECVDVSEEVGKKSKKRKLHDEEETAEIEAPNKKKKRKETGDEEFNNTAEEETEASQPSGGKFKWGKIIIAVLEKASDNELSLKKLRKKVLGEYAAQMNGSMEGSENKLLAKFEKKVKSQPQVKIHKDRAKLLPS